MKHLKHLSRTAMKSGVVTSRNRQPVNRQLVNRQPVHRQLVNRQPVNKHLVNRQAVKKATGTTGNW